MCRGISSGKYLKHSNKSTNVVNTVIIKCVLIFKDDIASIVCQIKNRKKDLILQYKEVDPLESK